MSGTGLPRLVRALRGGDGGQALTELTLDFYHPLDGAPCWKVLALLSCVTSDLSWEPQKDRADGTHKLSVQRGG